MNFEENDCVLKSGLDVKTIEILQSLYQEIRAHNSLNPAQAFENFLRFFPLNLFEFIKKVQKAGFYG